MKPRIRLNDALIAVIAASVGFWCHIVFLFIAPIASLAGLIANTIMCFFFLVSKKPNSWKENMELIVMAYFIGALTIYAMATNLGVSSTSGMVSAIIMPMCFAGIAYIWYDIRTN